MTMEPFGIEAEDVKAAEQYETLGPGYYAARRVAETVMRGSDTEPFKEIADKCADEIRANAALHRSPLVVRSLDDYLAGVRHWIYDSGRGLDIPTAEKLGWAVIIGSVVLTLLTVIVV